MANNGPYDVVLLSGGGNDLSRECPVSVLPCSIACAAKKEEIGNEMIALITQMVNDGSHVLLVGGVPSSVFSLSPTSAWYNECWELDTSAQDYAATNPDVTYVHNRDLANPNGRADYGVDGVHPSISLTQRIGVRVGAALDQILANLD